jgi:hypothetical protein
MILFILLVFVVGSIIFIAIVCAADKLTKAGTSTFAHRKNEKSDYLRLLFT